MRGRNAAGEDAARLRSVGPPRTLRANTLANFSGRVVQGVLAIAAVPVLVALLGTEAYGIVGLVAVLQIIVATLDTGLSTTATREVAQRVAVGARGQTAHNLVRTLEVVYWSLAVLVIALSVAGSGWLASRWLHVQTLSPSEVHAALLAAGVALAVRWPVSLYRGILDGFQLQVRENVVTIAAALVRFTGGIGAVIFISRTITAFMLWQVVAAVIEVAAMGIVAWRAVGRRPWEARFDRAIVHSVWRYMAALNVSSAAGLVLSQIDRIVISRELPLKELGYYSIALTATGAIPHAAASVTSAAFPRFSSQLARKDEDALRRTYRQAVHATAFFSIAVAFPLAFFAHDLLAVWVGTTHVGPSTPRVLTFLAVAYLLNSLYTVPYTLALASGHTRVPLTVNLVAGPILAAAMYVVVRHAGIVGAAQLSLGLMATLFVVYGAWIHRLVLHGELWKSMGAALRYALAGCVIFGGARLAADLVGGGRLTALALAGLAIVVYLGIVGALVPPDVRIPRIAALQRRYGAGRAAGSPTR